MATLDTLKQTLRQTAGATASLATQPLSQSQYRAGFDVLVQGSGWITYQDFIIPQLSSLLERLFNSRVHISVLEIGPDPKSVLGYLPYHVRCKITRYVAFEPNDLFAVRLDEWFHPNSGIGYPLPCLECRPDIHRIPFAPDNDNTNTRSGTSIGTSDDEKFDAVLFCHSMYGMKPKRRFIEHALTLLDEDPEGGIVVVFHRDGDLNFDGLNVGLTVISGSHSGQCLWPNVISIDMSAFDQVHMVTGETGGGELNFDSTALVIAEAGCNTGDIVRKTMVAGVTVPLGARPSVGSGLWLQGGVGHLARLHGLACDAIVGAVMISVASGQVLYVGRVPSKYRPAGAVQSEIETDLLWALKGAGTNFGIVVSVVFETHAARKYLVRNWSIPLKDDHDTRLKLRDFDQCAKTLPRDSSADAYLFSNNSQMRLGVTVIESTTTKLPSKPPKLTRESGVGKDYCADVWVPMLTRSADQPHEVHKASISDAIKREYAAATGADLDGLLGDRAYKEQHRPALTAFFKEQMRQQSWFLEKQFLNVVSGAADADVLVITGMRDESSTATLSYLVPNSRLLDIRVTASKKTRQTRRKCQAGDDDRHDNHDYEDDNSSDNGSNCMSNSTTLDYCPSLVFDNGATGDEGVRRFADTYLLPFLHGGLERLASMVLHVPDFPRPGIEFRHVLNIAQQQGGLALLACCEAGGFVYASALALQVGVPLALIREAGKLPPPTVSVNKPSSHISSSEPNNLQGKNIEMSLDLIPKGASVVVVDDLKQASVMRILESSL
ncbi:adenine phosphoribosyltransferase [Trichoderma arundinaceum]|uniref:Adenine phosphoribosyltransferase n=1 Tax=Trichoderma arundinaceum TaxID=490622 RepID=A0A395NNG4_TRIAR|nr:adenine phosphoribosyltransferase [Trichoderma arundinaceum]